jgi:hypothetical protein
MTLFEQMQSDLSQIETDLGNQSFTWKGLDIVCIPSSLQHSKNLENGGFAVGADKVFTVNLANFTNGIMPQLKESLTYRNRTYRIELIGTNPNQAFIRLHCVDVNKGV